MGGVAVLIFSSQVPKFLGLTGPGHSRWWDPAQWQPAALVVGGVTVLGVVLAPRLTKAVPAAVDTLKTCVVLDALTRTRHESNRELIGQGVGNLTSALAGGMPGAGTMGATLVDRASGGPTRMSGVSEGGFVLLAFLVLGRWSRI